MSRHDELISRLCPGGVEHRHLGELVEFRRGAQLKESDRTEGPHPVVTAGRSPNGSHGQANYDAPAITISSHGAYAGFVNYWDEPIWLANNVFLLEPRKSNLIPRFLFYALTSCSRALHQTAQGGGVPYINSRDLAVLLVPMPALEVQREIVRVLDQFAQLEVELEAELEARRSQYAFFENRLLSFSEGEAQWMTLGDIGKVSMCKRIFKNETSAEGDVPFFKIGTFGGVPNAFISQELYEDYRKRYPFPKRGDILLSAAGTIGRAVSYDGEPAYFQDSNIVWLDHDESLVTNAYLRYWYRVITWSTDGGTIRRLYNNNILRAKIAVPVIKDQERIVGDLNDFDALVNDQSVGLPAELNARRKQYEYYRDRLLAFEEAAA